MKPVRDTIARNLQRVEERITAACERAGRGRSTVTLIAVTKSVSLEIAAAVFSLGIRDLGENRPQALWRKAAAMPPEVRWHLIGHLQRNKLEKTVPLVHRVHSVDSLRLLEALDSFPTPCPLEVFLEVNCSREVNKQGFSPEAIATLVDPLSRLERVRVGGLMTMAAYEEDPERCRPTFATLRHLRDALREHAPPCHPLTELSMGMSNDFEVAIEEGATLVRVGTALFEGLPGEIA